MILTHFLYSTVKITYDEPVEGPGRNKHNCEEETWNEAQVFYKNEDGICTLTIKDKYNKKHIMLGRAKVIELTPWGARFEAYWWSSHEFQYNKDGSLSRRQKKGFKTLIRADVVCEF